MPPALPGTRPRSSVDEDLQKLYNDVLAGFDAEGPSLALRDGNDLDQIYRVYGDAPSNSSGNVDPAVSKSPYTSTGYTPTSPSSSHSCMWFS